MRDWVAPHTRFEDIYRSGPPALSAEAHTQRVESSARVTAPTLALSTSDDEFGTVPAIHRLLRYHAQPVPPPAH